MKAIGLMMSLLGLTVAWGGPEIDADEAAVVDQILAVTPFKEKVVEYRVIDGKKRVVDVNFASLPYSIPDEQFPALSKLKHLEKLSFALVKFNGSKLKEISELTSLKHLILCFTAVENQHLKYLAKLKNLEMLELEATRIEKGGLQLLGDFTALNHLDVSMTAIDRDSLTNIGRFKQLKILSLVMTHISDTGLREINKLDSLRELELSSPELSEKGLHEIRPILKQLEVLRYDQGQRYGLDLKRQKEMDLAPLEDATNLKKLTLAQIILGDSSLKHVASLTKLRSRAKIT